VEAEEKKRQKEAEEEDEEEKLEDLSPGKLSIPSCLRGMQLTLAEEIRRRRLARFG
jgi:hypothetical protein